MSVLRWISDLNKVVITSNFESRGWQAAEGSDDWDIMWGTTSCVQQLFALNSPTKLRPGQLVNHFPNHLELTRKDLLVKNVNRYRRHMRKAGHTMPAIIPPTFVLPQDYALFVEEFKKQPASNIFILKPASKAQGKGIFLVNKLSQVRQQTAAAVTASKPSVPAVFLPSGSNAASRHTPPPSSQAAAMRPALQDYVVSRYIGNPILVNGGRKFDLRLYVLVPSFQPLVVYLSSLGFARFTNVRYTREVAELDNQYVHLTNVAVQKEGRTYNSKHGNKWPLQDLRLHLEATHGHEATAQLFVSIQDLVVHTLKAVQPVIINDAHCFELYGFDVIIDNRLQPWLIEVNASPSMTSTTAADRLMKWQVVHDALSIVTQPNTHSTAPAGTLRPSTSSSSSSHQISPATTHSKKSAAQKQQERAYPLAVGCMQLIHHDGMEQQDAGRQAGKHRKAPHSRDKTGSAVPVAHKHIVLHG